MARQAERHQATPEELDHAAHVERCRQNPNAFIEYASGLTQASQHREWQELLGEERVSILGHAESGKTTQAVFRLLWELGRNPNLQVLVVCAAQLAAQKIVGLLRDNIDNNARVREVFPALRRGSTWGKTCLDVAGHDSLVDKDFSVQGVGWNEAFLGVRSHVILCDDINADENSQTPAGREKIIKRFDEKVQTRCLDGGRIWVLGNAWDNDDLVHTVGRREGFVFRRFSVLAENENGQLSAAWPEAFPMRRIAKLRRNLPPLSFARSYLCLPLADEASRFEEAWFEAAKERGVGFPYAPPQLPELELDMRWLVFTGVDLASGRKGAKVTQHALFTIAYQPQKFLVRVLDVQEGQWKTPELVARMQELRRRYDPVFAVEDNATQLLFVDSDNLVGLRVVNHTTGRNKWDDDVGVASMGLSLHAGRWIIPSTRRVDADGDEHLESAAPVERWIHDLLVFTRAGHTADTVMSSWIAVSAARNHSRGYFSIQRRAAA